MNRKSIDPNKANGFINVPTLNKNEYEYTI